MSSAERSVVVVGASAAGVSAAVALRRAGFEGSVTLVDLDPRVPYERPPLSKSLLGGDGAQLRPIVPTDTYAELGIELLLGEAVSRIDPDRGEVHLAGGRVLPADDIVLATGVRARPLEVPGHTLEGVMRLRDADDAERLRRHLPGARHLLVVGASFIGLELAALARQHGIEVTVLDVAAGPLVHAFDEQVGELVRHLHEDRGVAFRFGVTVRELHGSTCVETALLSDGSTVPADLVVGGIGVSPAIELARAAGIVVDGAGIVVDAFGRTSDRHVFACGDVASQAHPALVTRGRIEHWDTAMRHGAAVGATVAGVPTAYDQVPYAWSDQYGLTFQYFGRRQAGDVCVLREGATPEAFLAFWLRGDRMTAVLGCGLSKDVAAARRILEAGLPVDPVVLATATDLKAVLRDLRAAAPGAA